MEQNQLEADTCWAGQQLEFRPSLPKQFKLNFNIII
jgi:hypothetical protein